MSNSSDEHTEPSSEDRALIRRWAGLLSVIADELARTAGEVVKLGELISNDKVNQERPAEAYDLQVVDIFAQTANAQARLLQRLADWGSGHSGDGISAMIEEVPFARMRQRLREASKGEKTETPPDEDPDDTQVSWF